MQSNQKEELNISLFLVNWLIGTRIVALPAGQVPELQPCCSEETPLHAAPPFFSYASIFRALTCTPSPQVLLQVAHGSHVPHTQSTEIL